MLVLTLASVIAWARAGNTQLRENWIAGQAPSALGTTRQIFNGLCIGMLGLTGFECMSFGYLRGYMIHSNIAANDLRVLQAFRPT